jgi:type IV pilus assembly protein PilC
MNSSSKNNKKNTNVVTLPFIGIASFFKYVLFTFLDIIKLSLKGIKFLTIDSLSKLFNKRVTDKSAFEKKGIEKINTKKTKVKKESQFTKFYNNLWFVKKMNEKYEQSRVALIEELQSGDIARSKKPVVFWYRAKNKEGKMETGTINGYSKLDVNTFLIQEEYTVYEIKSDKYIDFMYGDTSFFATKMNNKDLLFWLTQLSTYIKSGIPLTDSVKILNLQMKNKKKYRKAFQSIVYELTMGEAFSKALEKQGSMFPALLINMIRAAEATGELETTLSDMATYYEEVESTKKEMISAITYPVIILVFAMAVITFILIYVIPQFVQIYEQNDAQINGLTLFIINLSNFLKANIWTLLLVIVVIIVTLYLCYKKIKAFRKNVQFVLMHLPVISKIIIYKELTIFTKTFASLLSNNVFITDSMDILTRITNNEIYKEIMNDTVKNIVKGDKISTSFKDHWAVPDIAYYMIVTGESTGQLGEMMQKVSNYYSGMHKSLVTNLKSFIEPVLISMLALVVGVIILAVIVPMFNLMSQLET